MNLTTSTLAGTQPVAHPHEDPPPGCLPPSTPVPPPRFSRFTLRKWVSRDQCNRSSSYRALHAGAPNAPIYLLPEVTPPHTLVSAISSGAVLPPALPSLIAEHGPGLSSGVATVDDASFTIRIKVHIGPSASSRYGLVALLEAGSPQAFISAEAWACMKHSNAASDICEKHVSPRSWGGFGKSAPLLTPIPVRSSLQFSHNSTPSAELAV